VLTAKLRRLLKQAVPVVMLVMQVIDETDETNNAGTSFCRTSRLLVPICGNTADVQNGPPMNADQRRWNEDLCLSAFICVHRRPNTGLPNSAQGLQTDGQDRTPSLPNVMFHLVCGSHLSQYLRPLNE
jgi:hypothetical protein